MIEWQVLAAVVAVAVAAGGLLKYILDKHKEHTDGRFKEHHTKIEKNSGDIKKNDEFIQDTRDELHRDYVNKNDYKEDLRVMNEQMNNNFNAGFKKMDAMARDLNRVIGRLTTKETDTDEKD